MGVGNFHNGRDVALKHVEVKVYRQTGLSRCTQIAVAPATRRFGFFPSTIILAGVQTATAVSFSV
jgi:hypothetical protein